MTHRPISRAIAAGFAPFAASACQSAAPAPAPVIELVVRADGAYFWNGERVSLENLEQRFKLAAAQTPQPTVAVSAERGADYETVAAAMNLAQKSGLTKLGVIGGT